jgi:hypothetical protein
MSRLAHRINLLFWGLAVLVLLAAAGWGVHLYKLRVEADRAAASSALDRGRALLNDLRARGARDRHGEALEGAAALLAQSEADLRSGRRAESLRAAEGALSLLEPVAGSMDTPHAGAVLVEGAGTRRNASSGAPVEAGEGTAVGEGESLAADRGGPLLLAFPDHQTVDLHPGGVIRVVALGDPDAPLRLALESGAAVLQSPPALSARRAAVVEGGDAKVRLSPGTTAEIRREGSALWVEVRAGAGEVTGGEESRTVSAGLHVERARAGAGGVDEGARVLAAPSVVEPRDEAVLWAPPGGRVRVELKWEASRAAEVRVQVSPSRLFARQYLVDRAVPGVALDAGAFSPGTYYWRLRAGGDPPGAWSPPHPFKVVEESASPAPADWRLEADATGLGDAVVVRGTVRPVLSVTVNGVEVPVGGDGTFMGTFPLYGGTVEVCAFDAGGRRLRWAKTLR